MGDPGLNETLEDPKGTQPGGIRPCKRHTTPLHLPMLSICLLCQEIKE